MNVVSISYVDRTEFLFCLLLTPNRSVLDHLHLCTLLPWDHHALQGSDRKLTLDVEAGVQSEDALPRHKRTRVYDCDRLLADH
jgi:hypothetical protein